MTQAHFKNWQPDTEPLPEPLPNSILLIKHHHVIACCQVFDGKWAMIDNNEWFELTHLPEPCEWMHITEV